MDQSILSEIVENQRPEEDEVLYLKPDVEIDDGTLEQDPELAGEDSNQNCICWSKKFDSEACCIAVHPKFPEVAQAAIGNCGDNCVICDFSTNSTDTTSDGQLLVLGPFEDTISSCLYSPSGDTLLLGCLDGKVYIHNAASGKYEQLQVVESMLKSVEWLNWHPDGSCFLFGGEGQCAYLCHYKPGSLFLHSIVTSNSTQCGKMVVYDATVALVGSDDGVLYMTKCGHPEKDVSLSDNSSFHSESLKISEAELICLDCSEKVQLAVVGTSSGDVHFVSLSKFKLVHSVVGAHLESVECVKFHPSVQLVASCGMDGNVVFWDSCKFSKISTVSLDMGLTRLLWHPNKSTVAVGDCSGGISVVRSGGILKEVQAHQNAVLDMAVLNCGPNDVAIMSVSQDFTAVM